MDRCFKDLQKRITLKVDGGMTGNGTPTIKLGYCKKEESIALRKVMVFRRLRMKKMLVFPINMTFSYGVPLGVSSSPFGYVGEIY